jgi:hypothetical protein
MEQKMNTHRHEIIILVKYTQFVYFMVMSVAFMHKSVDVEHEYDSQPIIVQYSVLQLE